MPSLIAQLIALAQQGKPRQRRRVYSVRPVALPAYTERDLLVLQVRVLRAWEKAYRDLVLPRYALPAQDGMVRDDQPEIDRAIKEAEAEVNRLLLEITPLFTDWVVRAERLHAADMAKAVKTATGVDLTTTVGLAPATETMEAVLARLINLVTGLSDDARKSLAEVVWRGFTTRQPRSAMAREIRRVLEVSRSRAMLIARDQTTKLAAVLDQERQVELGFDQYRWRRSYKLRPRPHHVARDGQLFRWKKPPYDGHPGYAINCGCKAEAYIDLDAL